jgi:hypothetical protein
MKTREIPPLVPTEDLAAYFLSNDIAFTAVEPLKLGFGHGNKQYHLYRYPAPAEDETMAVFCEWHTGDYFEVDSGPHIAIGIRGPVEDEPHRGRGLAIGILANQVDNPEDPDHPIPLFRGCPDAPGGPAFFIEDFSGCDGIRPISEWQLSRGQHLPQLRGNGIYRIDIHVSSGCVWAGVWEVAEIQADDGAVERNYAFVGQTSCSSEGPGYSGNPALPCPEHALDHGQGNVFIGTGFSDPETNSRVDNIYIAHWKGSGTIHA